MHACIREGTRVSMCTLRGGLVMCLHVPRYRSHTKYMLIQNCVYIYIEVRDITGSMHTHVLPHACMCMCTYIYIFHHMRAVKWPHVHIREEINTSAIYTLMACVSYPCDDQEGVVDDDIHGGGILRIKFVFFHSSLLLHFIGRRHKISPKLTIKQSYDGNT